MKRTVLITITTLSVFCANLKAETSPNIILILADDVSAKEYSIHGGQDIQTPALDRMAKTGLYFRTAWASPVCGPARSALLTGRYCVETDLWPNGGSDLRSKLLSYPLMGQCLQKAGYKTALFGKLHHGGNPNEYGFDEYAYYENWEGYTGARQRSYADEGMYSVKWYWNPGIIANGKGVPTTKVDFGPEIVSELLFDFITRNKSNPFFVFWPTNLPHHEYDESNDKWYRPDVPALDQEGVATKQRIPGSLKSNLEFLDGKLGRLQNLLKELGIQDNTIVVYTTDNGTAGYGKGRPENSIGIRVPLVVAGGGIPPIGPRDELVDFTDLFPTFLDLTNAKTMDSLSGHSFAPLLKEKTFIPRKYIHSHGGLQFPHERQGELGTWVRDERWLLDANGDLWDCSDGRDEKKYQKANLESEEAQSALSRLLAARETCQKL